MKYYLYAMGAIFCWASLPAATGSGLKDLSTPELMFYSFTSAALFLYLKEVGASRSFKIHLPSKGGILLGIWGIFLYHLVYYHALDRAPLAEGAILATTWSFWIVVFGSIIKSRRLKPMVLLTALAGLGGAALVIGSGKTLEFNPSHLKGYCLALCCGLIWSSFSVGIPLMKFKRDPMTPFTIMAALLSALLFAWTRPHAMPTPQALLSAVYLGTVPLGLSFFLWNRAVSKGNLAVIGFLSYLTPPLAVLLVALIHHQQVAPQVVGGMVVIIGAAIVGNRYQ
ncbi:MAG: DMT family transporter [Desulfobacteraceae bacterium]|nr:DMT family transporter [Desulfobacteraceae bacterium]